jgi:hypothetical protein
LHHEDFKIFILNGEIAMLFKMSKSMIQAIVGAALLSASVLAFAEEQQVLCPSVDVIKQSWEKLDTVTKFAFSKFAVWPVRDIKDQDYSWNIFAFVDAADFNSAMVAGQGSLQDVTTAKDKYAMDLGEAYVCSYSYSPNGKVSVSALAFKDGYKESKFTPFYFKQLISTINK